MQPGARSEQRQSASIASQMGAGQPLAACCGANVSLLGRSNTLQKHWADLSVF